MTPPQYQCSVCKTPFAASFNSVKRANQYVTTHFCEECMKDTKIEKVTKDDTNL